MPVPVTVAVSGAQAPLLSSNALSVSQIISRVERALGDESNIQITEADVIRWINDAQRELALHSNLLQAKAMATAQAGVAEFALPADVLTLRSIRFNGQKLKGISAQEAEEHIEDESFSGTPDRFWVWAQRVTLYPVPESGGELTIFYTRQPVNVVNTFDFPELPVQYHNRIVEYALKQAYELDENWQAAQIKGAEWTEGVNELRSNTDWVERDFYPSITSLPGDY